MPCAPPPSRRSSRRARRRRRSSRTTRQAAKALQLTFREALRLGHNYIGTEHILLGLLEQEAGAGVLSDLGLQQPAIEGAVVAMLPR